MNTLFYRLLIAVLALSAEGHALAAPSDDAREFAKKAAFAGKVVTCDARVFILSGDNELTQINKHIFKPDDIELRPADKLNGIDYEGTIKLVVDAYRVFDKKSRSWSEWEDPVSFDSILKSVINPGGSLLAGYEVMVQHKKGEWHILYSTVSDIPVFNCAKVHSIETGTFKENTVQLSGEAPRPFEPNAVLSRGFPWLNNCVAAAGTRVMDLGVSKAQPDYKSIVVDPAVCRPNTRYATASIVPLDAVESIQDWTEHPVTASIPPVQMAAPTTASRPTPAAPTIDPSRASLSHAPNQTFYTAAAVRVFVHGYQGSVLCIVPARSPVRARMQSRPPQFRGDYGVLAYKADLCPNIGSSQPRDMYHEFFFRASGASMR